MRSAGWACRRVNERVSEKEGGVTKWLNVGIAAVLVWCAAGDLYACGDKFLVPSRGMRFELTPSTRQHAAVLLYVTPDSALKTTLARLSVEAALRRAGYRPVLANDPSELDRLLREKKWDVVLLELTATADATLSRGGPMPAVIAVASKSNPVTAGAKTPYTAVLKSPSRSQAFVDAFDVAIATELAGRPRATQKTQ
jgi:hypothetical protein